jgi:4-hydroxy-2-oxoheptanedioate aldolase
MTHPREIWARGGCVLNGWLSIGNPFTAEIMAQQGYDALTVDVQHGALDYGDALPMLQAMRASGVFPMARASWREPGIVMKLLDAGAMGIICPMVGTREQAAEFASFLRYPPRGSRSYGPTRIGVAHGLAAYSREANDLVMGFAMIETAEGMRNLDAIAAAPGIDGLYIGPSDLSISLSNGRLPPGFDREEPEMIEAFKTIREAAHRHGIKACLHCGGPEYAARGVEWGFDLVTVSGDSRLLAQAAGASVGRFRELVPGPS